MPRFVALFSLFALGCGTDTQPEPEPTDKKLGVELTAKIPAGAEVEYCRFQVVPETWVTRDAVEFSAGSHHVLIYQTPYETIPTQKDDGKPIDTSGVFDCSDGATNGWSVTKLVGGSQNASGESMLSFPPGIGARIGGVLLINAHYRNASDADLDARVKVTWDTTTADKIEQEGDILFLYNPLISLPPGGESRAHWRCPVYADITIANVQSHMHARGKGYEARVDAATPFYVNDRWEGVPVKRYESFQVRAGSTLDYYCDYLNTSGVPIHQGPRTSDEMCMLIGSYYPADGRTARCRDESDNAPGGEWVGQGTATCAQTLQCIQSSPGFAGMQDCMLDASPAVSRTSSALVRCFMSSQDPGKDCSAQIAACSAE